MIHLFTSSGPNYAGRVATLAASVRRYCPELRFHWLLADVCDQGLRERVGPLVDEIWLLGARPLDKSPQWTFCRDLVEIATACKPILARELLDRDDCEAVIYLDPDMVLFSPLDEIIELLAGYDLLLTPHLLAPESAPRHETVVLQHGVFNLGFFAVRRSAGAEAILRWWKSRCEELCSSDWRSGGFTDQKWMNFAPIFFEGTHIVRLPGFNVAWWNLGERRLGGTFDAGFEVAGAPLISYHFSGLESGALERALSTARAGTDALSSMVRWYGERIRFLSPDPTPEWTLGRFGDGAPIRCEHRDLYRSREDVRARFPDPYASSPGDGGYRAWYEAGRGDCQRRPRPRRDA